MRDENDDTISMMEEGADVPSACPSYTEASMVDQAVPFIIFLSKYSKLKDRLSEADGLDNELTMWRDRYEAQQTLLRWLDRQLEDRQRGIQGWQRLLSGKASIARRSQAIQAEVVDLEAKKVEVSESAEQSQAQIDSIMEALTARQTLQIQCARQQAKLDRIYDKVFDKKEHEYAEESTARRALARAVEDSRTCSERLSRAESAQESLREAMYYALLCAKAFDAAQASCQQTMIMPTPAPAQFRAELNRAIGYEKRALEYLRMAMAMDPFILDGSGRLRVLSETFGSRLDAPLGTAIYTRARGLRPLVTETLSYLAGERQALRGRLYMHEQQHSIALRQGAAAQERLRNVRRTLFVDTLRGQDSSMGDPFVNQDQVTLLKWLKEALEAGRLSVPTAADLSTAMKDADRDDLPGY